MNTRTQEILVSFVRVNATIREIDCSNWMSNPISSYINELVKNIMT